MKGLNHKLPPNTTTAIERLYPWLLLLTIVALTWLLAQAFWLILAPPTAPKLTPIPAQPSQMAQPMTANALDIFAQPQLPQAQASPPPDMKILGVTVASPARFSYAIINANGKTQNYRVHDTIEGTNYMLTAVGKDFITVASGGGQPVKIQFGQPFSLDQSDAIHAKLATSQAGVGLNNLTGNTGTLTNNVITNNPVVGNSVPTVGTTGNPFSPTVNPTPPSGGTTNTSTNEPLDPDDRGAKAAIGGAVSNLQQNPTTYLNQMGVTATGQGYLVTDGMPAGLKNQLGLQTGDKVLSVNGQSIGQNPAQDAQLLQQVQQSGQAQIQVQRGEQTVTVRQSF